MSASKSTTRARTSPARATACTRATSRRRPRGPSRRVHVGLVVRGRPACACTADGEMSTQKRARRGAAAVVERREKLAQRRREMRDRRRRAQSTARRASARERRVARGRGRAQDRLDERERRRRGRDRAHAPREAHARSCRSRPATRRRGPCRRRSVRVERAHLVLADLGREARAHVERNCQLIPRPRRGRATGQVHIGGPTGVDGLDHREQCLMSVGSPGPHIGRDRAGHVAQSAAGRSAPGATASAEAF